MCEDPLIGIYFCVSREECFLFVCFVFLWVLSKVGSEVLGHKDPTHDVIVPEVLEDPVKRVAVAAPSLPRTRGRHISL